MTDKVSSISKLKEGLHQFLHTVHASERELFDRLASSQNPSALFITCADSRITPALITQTMPGELFVMRNVANIVPPYNANLDSEAAGIEYAVSALEVRDIIVCGHTNCGGVKAVLNPETTESLPAVKHWLRNAHLTAQIAKDHFAEYDEETRLREAVEVNVMAQLDNLRTHPTVASALHSKRVELHGWVYDVGRGGVCAFDCETDDFLPLTSNE